MDYVKLNFTYVTYVFHWLSLARIPNLNLFLIIKAGINDESMETDVNTETDSEVEAQNITDCKDTKATITTTSKSVDCVNDQIVGVEEKQQESLRYIYKMQ